MDMRVTSKPGEVDSAAAAHKRPSRRRFITWLVIVSLLLVLILGGLVGFDLFRQKMIAQFLANNVQPPAAVSAVPVTSESISDYPRPTNTGPAVRLPRTCHRS